MKVGFISTGLETGGAEMALLRLLPSMRRDGIESSVISLRSIGAIGPKLREAGIRVTALDLPGLVASVAAWPRLIAALRAISPTLLHGWMYHGNLAALAASQRLALPLAWGIRQSLGLGTRDRWLTQRLIGVGARLSECAQLIVYNSATARTQHEARGYCVSRGVVVPNGFETDVFQPDRSLRASVRDELRIPATAPVVIQVARYHASKDYPTLLRAAERVVAMSPETRFVLVGEGVDDSNEELTSLVRELNLGRQVRMLGRRDDVGRLLCAVDVAALSSAGMEGFPNAIGEAMSCGVPCVGTEVGDVSLLIGDTGEVVTPSEPAAMAAGLLRLLSLNEGERRALGERARQRVIDNFSIDPIARRYASLLRDAARAHR